MKVEGSPLTVEEEQAENLRDRTKRFALNVLDLVDILPERRRFWNLSKQISRSSSSVGANYREACRARSDLEFVAKIGDCLKELDETAWWLGLIRASLRSSDSESLPGQSRPLEQETQELLAIFTSIAIKVKQRLG